jgi:hypothetical protein
MEGAQVRLLRIALRPRDLSRTGEMQITAALLSKRR